MNKLLYLLLILTYVSFVSNESICGNWETINNRKCIKAINETNLMTYEEAVQLCSKSENGSTLITIHSIDEQKFFEKYLFETRKIVENVWLGLKNINNTYEWIDKTSVEFTNWANGSPVNKSDRTCVELSSDSSPIGKWVDIQCTRKLVVVCERPPTLTINYLEKMLFETKDELRETRKQLNTFLKVYGLHFNTFTDSDGKQRAFILPMSENKDNKEKLVWTEAKNICTKYNATLVEINSQQKQSNFESFLKQINTNYFSYIWLNAHKDSSGKWKWLRRVNDITFTNWDNGHPSTSSGFDYISISTQNSTFGKWFSTPEAEYSTYAICELEINPQILV